MQAALEELPEHERAERRLRLEHAQIMQLEDLTRAAKLGSRSSCMDASVVLCASLMLTTDQTSALECSHR